ncbi:MAG: hypothetical protein ABL908_08400 [Hyphomicrobium sp.]
MLDIERTLALIDEMFVGLPNAGDREGDAVSRTTEPLKQRAPIVRQVGMDDIARQDFVETCSGIPIFKLADVRKRRRGEHFRLCPVCGVNRNLNYDVECYSRLCWIANAIPSKSITL